MPLSNYFLLCSALFGALTPTFAQQHEFGVVAGISGYVGELARRNTLFNSGARANDRFIAFDNGGLSAFYKYRFNLKQESFLTRRAGLRANLTYMRIGAETEDNIRFRSDVYELAALYERDLYRIKIAKKHFIDFYGLAGVAGVMHTMRKHDQTFDPDANPLEQERGALAIPLGGGVKWRPNGDKGPWSIGVEALGRMTTDRIDGIFPGYKESIGTSDAQPNNFFFDIYKMLGIRISYTLFDCDCPQW